MRVPIIVVVSAFAFAILSRPAVTSAAEQPITAADAAAMPALEKPVEPCPTKSCAPTAPVDPSGSPVLPNICPDLSRKGVPQHAIDAALHNPSSVYGWGILHNPNVPASPYNTYRSWLTIRDLGQRYGPYNGLIFKSGCS